MDYLEDKKQNIMNRFNNIMVVEIKTSELREINGGNAGSRRGAKIAGRLIRIAILPPPISIYEAGKDLGWW